MLDLRERELSRVRRAVRLVEIRTRAARAVRTLPAALAGLAVAAALFVLPPPWLPDRLVLPLVATAALAAALVPLAAALVRLPPRAGAVALDRVHGLEGRLANALAFAEQEPSGRTALMEAAIDDACTHAARIDFQIAEAAPIHAPRTLVPALALATLVWAVPGLRAGSPAPAVGAAPPSLHVPPHILLPEDVESFDALAESLSGEEHGREFDVAIDEVRALLRDIASGQVHRAGVLRRLDVIERALPPAASAAEVAAVRGLVGDIRDRLRQTRQAGKHEGRRLRVFSRRARGMAAAGVAGAESQTDDLAGSDADDDPASDEPSDEPEQDPPSPPDPPPGSRPGVCSSPEPTVRPVPSSQDTRAPGRGRDDSPGPSPRGARTSLDGHALSRRAHAHDSGRGRIRSAVVLAAAQQGFRGAPYADVFRDYRSAAGPHLEDDTLPPGYRFYVRRYFLLIRPRD